MKITRDVVYDLLPGYFAGEVSKDTRDLIDDFLSTDPEFARMTARFRRLFDERAADSGARGEERKQFERVRSRVERRQMSAAFAVAYGLAAVFPLVMDLLRGTPVQAKSLFISVVFAAVAGAAAVSWIASRRSVI